VYYQGLHDVAGVLLLGGGPALAPLLLRHVLTTGGLPYATPCGGGIPLALDGLDLVMAVLRAGDPALAAHVQAGGNAPHWGLSWLLTWFAHDVPDGAVSVRLFDGFLGAHPALPLYVAACLLAEARATVLAADPEDAGSFHNLLKTLPARVLRTPEDAGRLLIAAAAALSARPPATLLAPPMPPLTAGRLQSSWPAVLRQPACGELPEGGQSPLHLVALGEASPFPARQRALMAALLFGGIGVLVQWVLPAVLARGGPGG